MLDEQLERLNRFMTDRKVAIEVLEHSDSSELDAEGTGFYQERMSPEPFSFCCIDANAILCKTVYALLLAGFDDDGPYLKFLMTRFHNARLKHLRDKLAIEVRASNSLFPKPFRVILIR